MRLISTDLGLGGFEEWVKVGGGWRRVPPETGAVGELLLDLLGYSDVGQQHELLHHGVGLPAQCEPNTSADIIQGILLPHPKPPNPTNLTQEMKHTYIIPLQQCKS